MKKGIRTISRPDKMSNLMPVNNPDGTIWHCSAVESDAIVNSKLQA